MSQPERSVVYDPMSQPQGGLEAEALESERMPAAATDAGGRARILVALQEEDVRERLGRLLSENYEVEAVADAAAALVAAHARLPDLVLADEMMPCFDRLAFARALRADPALRDVALVLLSARAGQGARIEGLHAGADEVLEKPCTAKDLGDCVAARLEIARARRDVEARVRAREEHLRAVVETTPECVKLVARDGTLLQMNPAGLAMVGASGAENVVGKSTYDLIAPEHRDAYRAFNERVCGGTKETLEFDMIGVSGERRHMETHAAPLRMPDGTTAQLALTRDVTERRKAEQALRESDRRKDEFIATLAHELRNPLAPLRSALTLLQVKARDDDTTANVRQVIERQVNHLVRLVDDLLEVSRIDRGMLELRRENVELGSIVYNAMEASVPLIREAGHHLEVELPQQPLWLRGDPVRLAQIFSNLLNNAARFTERGGRITIVAKEHEGRAWVSVRDTGVGFAPDAASHLFEMFSKSSRSSGLGIGLALSRRLAEMHGGTVEGQSEGEGRGAEFIVQLPLAAHETAAPAPASRAREAQAPVHCHVLIADDNRDSADMLAEWLRALGADVSLAYDGAEAVEVARAFRPDVAILDIGMPKLDGYQAAQRIRSESGSRRPKLVALTGWGQQEDRRRAREAGFDEHLVKPADLDALRALLVSATLSNEVVAPGAPTGMTAA